MFFDKKGEGNFFYVLAGLIVILIAIFFITDTTLLASDYIDVRQGEASCQTWARVQASSLAKPLGVEIQTFQSPCESVIEEIRVKSDRELYTSLADRSISCFASYDYGVSNFYKEYTLKTKPLHCRVCNEVRINPESNTPNFDWGAYQFFLNSEKPKFSKETYAEILTGVENAQVNFGKDSGVQKIDFQEPFYVLFTVARDASLATRVEVFSYTQLAVAGVGTFAGGVITIFVPPVGITALLYGAGGGIVAGSIAGIFTGSTVEDFRPGVSLMVGPQAIAAGCDPESFYFNPKYKDKDIKSVLANRLSTGENSNA